MKYISLLCSLLSILSLEAQQLVDITPTPVHVKELKQEGAILQKGSAIIYDHFFAAQAVYLQDQIRLQCGIAITLEPASANKSSHSILLLVDSTTITKKEMYSLEIKKEQVIIKAKSVRGIINGMQTLLQLNP